jgi:hypothetical protein
VRKQWLLASSVFVLSSLFLCTTAAAGSIFVDNSVGSDALDGRVSVPSGGNGGPVRTISRALELVRTGDNIEINNTSNPYYESLTLFGPRHSGFTTMPFTIEGNGAIVDGSAPIPYEGWKEVEGGLWKVEPFRKGYYQLLHGFLRLPEVPVDANASRPPALLPGQWSAWRGTVYYQQSRADEYPPTGDFRLSKLGTGVTLYRVHDVTVRNLNFVNFRVDGINSPDLCQRVSLENVTSSQNGRSGLFVGGTSIITATRCSFVMNREHQLLFRGKGTIQLDESETNEPPVKVE